jgi:hypothetical protein
MHIRYILFIAFCYCFIFKATGQELYTINGIIYKKSSPDRVAQVVATNLRTKSIMMADELGSFHIGAAIGDTLLFKKTDYASQIFVISSSADILIRLQPIILLNQVNIKEETKRQEISDMMKLYQNQGGYYTLKPTAWSMLSSPLTGFNELFGKQANRARQFKQHTAEELEHIEVTKRYNKPLITKVTGVTDEKELQHFTDMFTPAYEDIKIWSEYDIVNYIKKSYEYYKNNKNQAKLPSLY